MVRSSLPAKARNLCYSGYRRRPGGPNPRPPRDLAPFRLTVRVENIKTIRRESTRPTHREDMKHPVA